MESEPLKLFHQQAEQLPHKQPLSASPEEHSTSPDDTSGEQNTPASTHEPSDEVNARMLLEMAQITVQSFHSSQEAMHVALEVIGHFLDCQSLFIARFGLNESGETNASGGDNADQPVLKIIETRNTGTPSPVAGSEGALDRTYCATILRTQKPLIVEDVQRYPFYQQLSATREYHIGSYIGVPLIYSDGRIYGTLCSQDPRPRLLADLTEKLKLMQIVARFLISHIEREELTTQLRAAEKAQAELARKEQQARVEADRRVRELEAIFEAIGDGLFVCNLNGRVQMNAAARNFLPLVPETEDLQHIIEKYSEDTFVRDEYGQPFTVDQLPITRVLRGERLIGAKVVNLQQANKSGEKRYLSVSGMPIYDQQGNGGVLLFRDVTERYLLEQQTQETLNALLTLAESLAWLPENALEFFSAAPSNQAPALQLTWQHLRPLISTILRCQDAGIISLEPETAKWQLLTDGEPAHVRGSSWWQEAMSIFGSTSSQGSDTERLRNNEVVIHALRPQAGGDTPMLVAAPMFLGNHLLGVLALIYSQHEAVLTPGEDALAKAVAKLTGLVHERESLLQEQAETRAHALALQEINTRFNEFLSIASHELKGPLTTFQGNIQFAQRTLRTLLSQRVQEGEEVFSALEKIQRYLERAEHQISVQNRLTSDLIDVSRIRAGKLELHMQPCDLGQIAREVVENQRQVAEGRVINLELPAEKIVIFGDEDRLGQVVSNYLTNALKYSSFDKPVEVAVTTDSETARVTVSDQGTGLNPDEQEYIWERFYRVKDVQVLSGSGIGLGLGLHICKTIVEQHSGCVGLHSQPGKGSHFWFTLPLSTDLSFCWRDREGELLKQD
jgi:signal transduction histidine kinase/PAS domain-containing protein